MWEVCGAIYSREDVKQSPRRDREVEHKLRGIRDKCSGDLVNQGILLAAQARWTPALVGPLYFRPGRYVIQHISKLRDRASQVFQ